MYKGADEEEYIIASARENHPQAARWFQKKDYGR